MKDFFHISFSRFVKNNMTYVKYVCNSHGYQVNNVCLIRRDERVYYFSKIPYIVKIFKL